MKSRDFLSVLTISVQKRFERKRSLPFHRAHRSLINQMIQSRDLIRAEDDEIVKRFLEFCCLHSPQSYSQLFQDLFVAFVLNGKRNGFFCEFGATNGVSLSNTLYLERELGWTGICAEPARGWHEELKANRPSAIIDHRCVWVATGEELTFSEADERSLSSITTFSNADGRGKKRARSENYQVKTVSLTDLLLDHKAPKNLDFISIDTEGSELKILSALDFSKFTPKIFAVEHNFMPVRDDILALLTSHGYRRVLTECSQWDDWYLAPGVELPS